MTRRGTRTHKQQSNRLRGWGLDGDDNNKDDDDDDGGGNDDDDDGRCGGRGGHHRMRKGREHDNRTNTTIK